MMSAKIWVRWWLVGMVLVVAIPGCATLIGSDPSTDAASVFEAAWHEIDAHYPFFAYEHLDWDAVHARYAPRAAAARNTDALASVLCDLVNELRSYHAGLYTSASGNGCGYRGPRYPSNYDQAVAERALAAGARVFAAGRFRAGALAPDIGYIAIPSFEGSGWADAFDDALDALGPVRGLVIDIRGNGGGNESNGLAVAGRFATARAVYALARFRNGPGHDDFTAPIEKRLAPQGRRHFSGPVALLTNRGNGSAAEDFVMMMRVIPTTFTLGDTTIGNSSNPVVRELPNGWQLRLPQSIQTTPDGFVPEGRGFPPDIPVMLDSAAASRGVDTIVQRAVDELRTRAARFSPVSAALSPR